MNMYTQARKVFDLLSEECDIFNQAMHKIDANSSIKPNPVFTHLKYIETKLTKPKTLSYNGVRPT